MGTREDRPAGKSSAGGFDLHSHSTFSDGSFSAAELVCQARELGLQGLAITDHDWLGQLSEVRATARELGFPVLAGVEVSAFDPVRGRKVHMLGFGLEATPDESGPLERLVAPTRAARTANTLWQAWVLQRAGIGFRGNAARLDDTAAAASASGSVFKQHLMWALTGLPYTDAGYQAFYREHFKNGGIADRDIVYPDALDAVRAIREQGGTPVLAHPGQTDSWGLVDELARAGLQGIEAHHPDHTPADTARARAAAERCGLFVTGGSDFHGAFGRPSALGVCRIGAEEAGAAIPLLFAREAALR